MTSNELINYIELSIKVWKFIRKTLECNFNMIKNYHCKFKDWMNI